MRGVPQEAREIRRTEIVAEPPGTFEAIVEDWQDAPLQIVATVRNAAGEEILYRAFDVGPITEQTGARVQGSLPTAGVPAVTPFVDPNSDGTVAALSSIGLDQVPLSQATAIVAQESRNLALVTRQLARLPAGPDGQDDYSNQTILEAKRNGAETARKSFFQRAAAIQSIPSEPDNALVLTDRVVFSVGIRGNRLEIISTTRSEVRIRSQPTAGFGDLAITDDGSFVYAVGEQSPSVEVFRREQAGLRSIQVVTNSAASPVPGLTAPRTATVTRPSHGSRLIVGSSGDLSCDLGYALVMFSIAPSGELGHLATVREGDMASELAAGGVVGLRGVKRIVPSHDGRFIYAVGSAPGESALSSLTVFRVENDTFVQVQHLTTMNPLPMGSDRLESLAGVESMALAGAAEVEGDDSQLYVVTQSRILLFDRDAENGLVALAEETPLSELMFDDGCASSPQVVVGADIVVSDDRLWLAGQGATSIVEFRKDPEDGSLAPGSALGDAGAGSRRLVSLGIDGELLLGGASNGPVQLVSSTAGCLSLQHDVDLPGTRQFGLLGAAGIAAGPAEDLYVVSTQDETLTVFEHGGSGLEIVDLLVDGLEGTTGLRGVRDVAVWAPYGDRLQVYTVASPAGEPGVITTFSRGENGNTLLEATQTLSLLRGASAVIVADDPSNDSAVIVVSTSDLLVSFVPLSNGELVRADVVEEPQQTRSSVCQRGMAWRDGVLYVPGRACGRDRQPPCPAEPFGFCDYDSVLAYRLDDQGRFFEPPQSSPIAPGEAGRLQITTVQLSSDGSRLFAADTLRQGVIVLRRSPDGTLGPVLSEMPCVGAGNDITVAGSGSSEHVYLSRGLLFRNHGISVLQSVEGGSCLTSPICTNTATCSLACLQQVIQPRCFPASRAYCVSSLQAGDYAATALSADGLALYALSRQTTLENLADSVVAFRRDPISGALSQF